MARFFSPLVGEYIDDVLFKLHEPLIYESDVAEDCFSVPKGFVTDFASVPRVPVVYMMFGDRAHHESVIHDFLYQTHLTTKVVADKVFREAMRSRGKPWYVVQGMYWGVVFGGRSSYKSGPSRYLVLNGSDNQGGGK